MLLYHDVRQVELVIYSKWKLIKYHLITNPLYYRKVLEKRDILNASMCCEVNIYEIQHRKCIIFTEIDKMCGFLYSYHIRQHCAWLNI